MHAPRAALRQVGVERISIAASSTDSNWPMSLGIPSVTLSSAGIGGGSHSLNEWYMPVNNWLGPQNVLLITLGPVGLDGTTEPLLPKRQAQ